MPDWSSLLDAAAIATGSSRGAKDSSTASGSDVRERDWARLQTRADVVAALREDYPIDEAVRHATDAAVRDLAFLARLDVPLEARGVRSVPRGMRWWWTHLGGASGSEPAVPHQASASPSDAEPVRVLPLQLRLTDVMAGYGDGDLPSDLSERTTR